MSLAESQELAESLAVEECPDANERNAAALLALPRGVHAGVPESVYHARVLGMASKSGLDELRHSPLRYKAWSEGKRDRSSKVFTFGKAIHCAQLEPQRFDREYVVAPDFGDCRKRDNKLERDRWRKEHSSATVLRNEEGLATLAMVRSVATHELASALFGEGVAEATVRWRDPATNVDCKARPDWWNPALRTMVDVKSIADASDETILRDAWNYGYYRQAAFYLDGMRAVGSPVEHFVFCFVEKTAPFDLQLFEPDPEYIELGHRENTLLLDRLSYCVSANEWPGYDRRIKTLTPPRWAKAP